MTTAYFDCFSGASGDMIVGALLAAGADLAALRADLAVLGLDAVTLGAERVARQGITATKFEVLVKGAVEPAAVLVPDHDHHHPHDHDHDHPHAHDHGHGRTLPDVEEVLSRLPAPARDKAIAIFRRLAEAEAAVHGSTAPFVHFHEVGMDDALVDVAAAVLALEQLGVTRVVCSPLPLGSGTVRCAHGTMPVPVPAVVELVRGVPTYDNGERGELVTPTGAAILTTLADTFGPVPAWTAGAVGYGAGQRAGQRIPNLLRVMLGEEAPAIGHAACLLEANLDDMTPQLAAALVDRLLGEGALDVTLTPTVMKKGRPGVVLSVLAPLDAEDRLADLVFAESTTLGLRRTAVTRRVLDRAHHAVPTPWGEVGVKVGSRDGQVLNAAPEYEDCRRLAEDHGVPLKAVWQAAQAGAWQLALDGAPWRNV